MVPLLRKRGFRQALAEDLKPLELTKSLCTLSRLERQFQVSVATPAEPRGEKKLFFVQILGGEKLLKFVESAGEIFLSGLRGAKNISNTFRIVFRIFIRVCQTVFRIDLKVFRGQFRSADMPP